VHIIGCFNGAGDTDFDGPSYQEDWPGTNPDPRVDQRTHPEPVIFTSPTEGATSRRLPSRPIYRGSRIRSAHVGSPASAARTRPRGRSSIRFTRRAPTRAHVPGRREATSSQARSTTSAAALPPNTEPSRWRRSIRGRATPRSPGGTTSTAATRQIPARRPGRNVLKPRIERQERPRVGVAPERATRPRPRVLVT